MKTEKMIGEEIKMQFIKSKKETLLKYWEKHPLLSYFSVYTILFCMMCIFVFGYFAIYRKSFIYNVDGGSQHANALAYYGEYLRNIIKDLMNNHKLTIPMWDMNIGFGSDIITTLHYYVIGDPLTLAAVFVPKQYTEILYIILILFRFYLTGLSFSCYCLYHKNKRFPTLIGALAFCFTGYSLYAGIRHPYFINPMIYLPFILIGIDKIFKKEKPYLFVIAVFISAVSNFYFFYMICIFIFLYAVFCYVIKYKKIKIKELIPWLARFISYFAVAIGMACVILLPVVMSMLTSNRIATERSTDLLYARGYYERFLTSFLVGKQPDYWSVMGYTPMILLSIFTLFIKKNANCAKENKHLKIGFLMLTFFLFIPFIGRAINGFSYVSNRFIWVYAMLNVYIFVKMSPVLFTLNKKEKNNLITLTVLYAAMCLLFRNARTTYGLGAVLLLVVIEIIILFDREKFKLLVIRNGLLLVATCIGIIWSSYSLYSINMLDYTSEYYSLSYLNNFIFKNLPSNLIKDIEDDSFFRYDQYGTGEVYNSALQQKLNSTTFYFSLSNKYVSEYLNEMYLNFPFEHKYNNMDQRVILDTIASVKYYLIANNNEKFLPYNYNHMIESSAKINGKTYNAYKGSNTLPLGYTYNAYIDRKQYDKMTVTKKQQALLQGCVLDESSHLEATPVFEDKVIPYEITGSKGVKIEDGRIIVTKANAAATLKVEGLDNSETYMIMENLKVETIHPLDVYTDKEWNNLSAYSRRKEQEKYKYFREPVTYTISIKSGNISKSIVTVTENNNFYGGKHDYLCNLGYSVNPKDSIVLTFDKIGVYTFDDLRIVCQPMDNMNGYIDELKESVLKEVVISDNVITGSITLEQPKILVMSIPYSEGWNIKVDGKESKLMRANTMYMAVELGEGFHEIELNYVTPYIKPGLLISFISLMALIGIGVYFKINMWLYRRKCTCSLKQAKYSR